MILFKVRILIFVTLLVLTCSVSIAQSNGDSLRYQLNQNLTDDERVETLIDLFAVVRQDSVDEATKYIFEALNLQQDVEGKLQANLFFMAGEAYHSLGKIKRAIEYYEKALAVFHNIDDTLGLAKTSTELGLSYYTDNQMGKSTEYYLKAQKIYEKLGLEDQIIDLNNRKAFVLIQQEQFDEALDLLITNYKRVRKKPLSPQTVKAAFNLANLFQRTEDLELALLYADSTEVFSDTLGFEFGRGKAAGMKTYILMDLQRFDEAFVTAERASEIFTALNVGTDQFQMKLAQARIHQESGHFAKMIPILKNLEVKAQELDNKELLKEFYDARYNAFKNIGQYEQALESFEKRTALYDSIFKIENAEKVNELLTKYETEKKDQEIENLSQQAEIQALRISQRNNQLLGAGAILLILVLGGYVYTQQRKFKHQQAVSDMEQRMLRLQMNPHFIFNALASIQNYILQSDTKESVKYLAKFGKLMRQILEHSREEFITIAEEADMLTNYLEIQQLRFKNSFDFKIEIADDIDAQEIKIPPLFAQPFVENAIEHGLKDKSSQGTVVVRFKSLDNNIELEVEDNGKGVVMAVTKGHKSLATKISKERLEILSSQLNGRFELEMKSGESGSGTLVRILLPSHLKTVA